MIKVSIKIICLFAGILLLAGCSSVTVLETWHNSSAVEIQHKKLLVINLNLDENVRKMYEDVVSGEMTDSGIMAVAGHSYLNRGENYTKDNIRNAVTKSGCDAVLTIRGLTTGNQQIHQQGQGNVLYGEGLIPSSWDDTLIATLQVNLYNSEQELLVWSSRIKARDDDNKFIESRDIGKLLIRLLKRDGMVHP